MTREEIDNLNIVSEALLPTPFEVRRRVPMSDHAATTVSSSRQEVKQILDHADERFLLVIGPCSIHDLSAAQEYARRLKELADEVRDSIMIVMRVYFEKPRTSVGWKGFINDPCMDDSFRIEEGLQQARALLLWIAELGLPVGTEALDPITPQYLSDLLTWCAIGARTTESQTHREMSSGLSTPVGFKNGTDGNIEVAINALRSAAQPHRFLGINHHGQCAVFHTRGNRYGHIVLRGGIRPNYDRSSIEDCERKLAAAGLAQNIMIDCSHGNSLKDPSRQPLVLAETLTQVEAGNRSIIGWMIESHLHPGRQDIPADLKQLKYGVSITDGCIGWEETRRTILEAHARLQQIRVSRKKTGI